VLGFLASRVAQRWVEQGRLIPTAVLDRPANADAPVRMEHPRIFFPSYPWEWTPRQWIAAAELTLDLCEDSLDQGLILKDATPLNILFDGPQPIFIDVLSVEPRDPASPIWMAYAQFVRTFLLPLAACKYLGWPLAASLQKRDGYEPADLYPYLSRMQQWTSPFRSLVTLPYLLERREKNAISTTGRWKQSPDVATAILRRNLRSLRRTLHKLVPSERESRWSGYTQNADHYSEADSTQKQAFVRNALTRVRPETVLDLGANTGVYSRIGAELRARVVAWDTDVSACEQNWRAACERQLPVQVLVADPSRPTPATGWRNAETLSLLDRARGQFDCVLMLGLVHHLLLADQIPLDAVAGLVRDLTRKWAIVEWVPPTDPRFVELMRGRDSLYANLSEAAFMTAFQRYFSCIEHERLKNGRTLFLFMVR
jgi:SAM-dependent methyltransferase